MNVECCVHNGQMSAGDGDPDARLALLEGEIKRLQLEQQKVCMLCGSSAWA